MNVDLGEIAGGVRVTGVISEISEYQSAARQRLGIRQQAGVCTECLPSPCLICCFGFPSPGIASAELGVSSCVSMECFLTSFLANIKGKGLEL